MIELDTRQQATLIWFGLLVITLIIWPKTRRALFPAAKDVLKVMATWKIIVPFAIYFIYAMILVCIARKLGIWNANLLTDTLIIIFFVGIPMFANANSEKGGTELFAKTLRETIGISALIAFYIGLEPLSLTGEIILQPIIVTISILALFASYDSKHKLVQKIMNSILTIIGLWLIMRTIGIIVNTWHADNVDTSFVELLLSILLPLALLPIVYIFALVMRYEIIFRVSKNFTQDKYVSKFAYIAILTRYNVQLRPLNELGGIWLQKVVQSSNYREAGNILTELKHAIREQRQRNRIRSRRLRAMRGKVGVDGSGLQLDRREFYESKNDLENLLYVQKGQFNTGNHMYNPDLPIQLGFSKLPRDHGITMVVRKDKKSWYAWRRMPSGYFFGVGGTSNGNHIWLYESSEKLTDFPSKNRQGWVDSSSGVKPPEWQFDDTPPRIIVPESYFDM